MDALLHRFESAIKGTLEGFDRIVFKGNLRPLCHAAGMALFLSRIGVLNKGYKDWVTEASEAIVKDVEEYTRAQCGTGIQHLSSHRIRKETLAHEWRDAGSVQSGLIGTWSCVESCNSFKAVYDKEQGFPRISPHSSRCKHLYLYYDHEEFGFMSMRLQTWAPYEVQIALNGREWLRRMLDKHGVKYVLSGNKFLDIEDFEVAQQLLNTQIDTQWIELLSGFLPDVFPSMKALLGDEMSYTWTLWQSEWAKDYVFHDPLDLQALMGKILRHAFITGTSDRVLRYMGRPVRKGGQPHWAADPELATRVSLWRDGARIRHWLDKNSLKLYNEQNVLRFEFTMNNPAKFRIYRCTVGSNSDEKRLLPMRKGVADVAIRTQVCSLRIKSLTEQVATLDESATVGELLSEITGSVVSGGKKVRGLDATGKDLSLLKEVADPRFQAGAITNRHLQAALASMPWAKGLTGCKLSARISRHLRLLRQHGIIKKLPNQHRYMLTSKGRSVTMALDQLLGTSLSDLAKLAA